MGLLRDRSALAFFQLGLLAFVLLEGCSFQADLGERGYQVCPKDQSCPGGFACLRGVCVPDCIDLDELAKVEPGEDDCGLWECSPDAYCAPANVDDGGPARLEVFLSPGDFFLLGPGTGVLKPAGCSRVIVRMSLLAREQDAGRLLTIMLEGKLGGQPVEGTYGDIELKAVPEEVGEGRLEDEFEANTIFLAVSTDTFGWPIKLKLVPAKTEMQPGGLAFAARLFFMYACQIDQG